MSKEKILDELITPLMLQIAAICKEHGIPVLASFEYAPGQACTTAIMTKGTSVRMQLARSIIMGDAEVASVSLAGFHAGDEPS